MFKNLLKPFRNKKLLFIYLFLVALATFIWWYFTDIAVMFGNYGSTHTWIDIGLSIVLIVGFPLFLVGIIHKGILFGSRENLHQKTGYGLFGGILGTIISGASCCGSTLAIYFGLTPLMTLLPYDGLELKVLSVLGLIYALIDLYTHLETCRIDKKK